MSEERSYQNPNESQNMDFVNRVYDMLHKKAFDVWYNRDFEDFIVGEGKTKYEILTDLIILLEPSNQNLERSR